jgi:hypothetical protein
MHTFISLQKLIAYVIENSKPCLKLHEVQLLLQYSKRRHSNTLKLLLKVEKFGKVCTFNCLGFNHNKSTDHFQAKHKKIRYLRIN